MDCQRGSAVVSWRPGAGAVSYIAELTAPSGHAAGCATNATGCALGPVRCGEEYNVTVKAVGAACNSTAHMTGYLSTGALHLSRLCSPLLYSRSHRSP